MSEYKKEIENMCWSYSRLSAFDHCKYSFYLKYIEKAFAEGNFYAESGTFVHEILEKYFNDKITLDEAARYYVEKYDDYVCYKVKQSIMDKSFEACADYFANVDFGWLNDYEILGVELELELNINGYKFTGFIDLLIRHKKTGDIIVIDHKSAAYPFKKDGVSVLKKSQHDFAQYKRQMYLYSKGVKEKYGVFPKELWWNHFKEQKFAKITFDQKEYEESIEWFVNQIHAIEQEEDFEPKQDFFYCSNLCDFRNSCEYRKGV